MTRFTVTFATFFFLLFQGRAAIIYVDINATGADNGTTWTDAFVDLQSAIALSVFGDEIWVAQGVYKPTQGTSRTVSFSIKNGTKLYGGFIGGETDLTERDYLANSTILSGEIGTGAVNDNSYKVVSFSSVANQTRLDGFTITAGYNNSSYGGGATSVSSSPVIANCIFQGNFSSEGGGAINHSTAGILTLENCTFDGNVGNTYGGGALRLYAGTVNISNCYFKSNQSNTYGGAIYIYNSTVNINHSVFAGNVSETTGSAIRVGDVGTFHLHNSLVVGNYSHTSGTIWASTFSNSSAHTIRNSTIAHNKQLNSNSSSTASTVALNNEASISNSIIYGNSPAIQVLGTGVGFSHNITQSSSSSASGTNILYTDPLFIAPGDVNNAPFEIAGLNYRLDILSEGIDYGLNASVSGTTDLDGNVRIQNSTVDLGAYESGYCASASTFASSGPYTICGGTPITLSVVDGVQHAWSTGSTSNTINISTAGNYSVIFEDIDGCRGQLFANVTSISNPSPGITFTSGSLQTGSFSTYQWSFNGAEISGAITNSHVPLQGYGLYEVEVTNTGGCIGNATYCLSPAEISADGPTTFCEGESVTLSVSNGNSHVWSTGSLNSSIAVNSNGTYTVTVLNTAAGCSVHLQQSVIVYTNPSPAISIDGTNLTTSTFSTYQWNYNGNPIPGATFQNLDPTLTGNGQYTVTVTNSDGCESTSATFNLSNLSVSVTDHPIFKFFPNPISAGSILTILFNEWDDLNNQIILYNSIGARVCTLNTASFENQFNLPNLEKGVYFIAIENIGVKGQGHKLIVN
jgi:predicted outer membrane repeat protein